MVFPCMVNVSFAVGSAVEPTYLSQLFKSCKTQYGVLDDSTIIKMLYKCKNVEWSLTVSANY